MFSKCFCRGLALVACYLLVTQAVLGGNLLKNGDFSQEMTPVWEKRTPDSDDIKISHVVAGDGRKGAAVLLETFQPVEVRLRQGHDRSIVIKPGSIVMLQGWVKTELDDRGIASLQLFFMDEAGKTISAPYSAGSRGRTKWHRVVATSVVPENTAYVMAYAQQRSGVGEAKFADLELRIVCPPRKLPGLPTITLLSDLSPDHEVVQNLNTLFTNKLTVAGSDYTASLENAHGAIVLYADTMPAGIVAAVKKFASQGGRVFMDIRNFAAGWQTQATAVELGRPVVISQPLQAETKLTRCPANDRAFNQSVRERMQAGLKVVKVSDSNAGFSTGQIMPRVCWSSGKLMVLPQDFKLEGMEVLAVGPGGEPGLVELNIGKGKITACDLLSLRDPFEGYIDSFYAYTPVSGALGNPPELGEYYTSKVGYDEVIREMQKLADKHSNLFTMKEEGVGSAGDKIWSLNLGKPGTPLYFIYALTHGEEWEPGYGLITFARRIAEGKLDDVIDLNKVRIKILPVLNPSAYKQMIRKNNNGVDLNRQGDYRWGEYRGWDPKNKDSYGPKRPDWKGSAPFTEVEAKIYQTIVSDPDLLCLLDFHGTLNELSNKLAICPATGAPDNHAYVIDMQRVMNNQLWGRHLLRQNLEKQPSQFNFKRVLQPRPEGGYSTLQNTAARNGYGLLVELRTCYSDTYGTLLQTDLTCEFCRALFISYPPQLAKIKAANKATCGTIKSEGE